jgi:glutamate transport system permease protein
VNLIHAVVALVVLPQALRSVVGPLGSLFIALIKNSALATLISVNDLAGVAEHLINETAQPLPIFFGVAVAYLLLTLPSGYVVNRIERRVAIVR